MLQIWLLDLEIVGDGDVKLLLAPQSRVGASSCIRANNNSVGVDVATIDKTG
jgi:hypothetical protein